VRTQERQETPQVFPVGAIGLELFGRAHEHAVARPSRQEFLARVVELAIPRIQDANAVISYLHDYDEVQQLNGVLRFPRMGNEGSRDRFIERLGIALHGLGVEPEGRGGLDQTRQVRPLSVGAGYLPDFCNTALKPIMIGDHRQAGSATIGLVELGDVFHDYTFSKYNLYMQVSAIRLWIILFPKKQKKRQELHGKAKD